MGSGGARANAGRRSPLTRKQRLQIGAACERDWQQAHYGGSTRPYRARERIVGHHVQRVSLQFGVDLSE